MRDSVKIIWGEAMQVAVDKSQDYGDDADTELGAKGQYAEIHRKMRKLKRALWEGHELTGEPVEEVLMDLMSHCALAIDNLRAAGDLSAPRRLEDRA